MRRHAAEIRTKADEYHLSIRHAGEYHVVNFKVLGEIPTIIFPLWWAVPVPVPPNCSSNGKNESPVSFRFCRVPFGEIGATSSHIPAAAARSVLSRRTLSIIILVLLAV